MDEQEFDPQLILETLEKHGVEYVLVGGLGARAHGASRPTMDIDCVPSVDEANLDRLAAALRDLGARLRVGGMTDEEARQLPVHLDAATLWAFGSSTWMTDAGPIDLLRELRDLGGADVPFEELREASTTRLREWWCMSPISTTSSQRRNTRTGQRTARRCPNFVDCVTTIGPRTD